MPYVVLHCHDPALRDTLAKQAKDAGLAQSIPAEYASNPHALQVGHATSSESVAEFARAVSSVGNVVALSPDAGVGRFEPLFRRDANRSGKNLSTARRLPVPGLATPHFGRTAGYMAEHYAFPPAAGTAASRAQRLRVPPTIAVISLGGSYKPADLKAYWKTVMGLGKLPPTPVTIPVDGYAGTFTASTADEENTLDLEIAGGTCPAAAALLFYSAPNTYLGFYHAISAAVSGSTVGSKRYQATVVSISWGAPESSFPTSTLQAFDQLLALAASKGIVVCAASGDGGSADSEVAGPGAGGRAALRSDFPSSSPHVVACGGTTLTGAGDGGAETAWSWNAGRGWGGGGGFSGFFAQPAFQAAAVAGAPKRSVPDIALNADPLTGWSIQFNGRLYVDAFGGTSCVAPCVAGLVARMNLAYPGASASAPPFLAALYQAARPGGGGGGKAPCFNDVVAGSNDNVGVPALYSAGKGYDLCTGLGSPDGTKLLAAFTAPGFPAATDQEKAGTAVASPLVTTQSVATPAARDWRTRRRRRKQRNASTQTHVPTDSGDSFFSIDLAC